MVDPIGNKAGVAPARRVAPAGPTDAVGAAKGVNEETATVRSTAAALASALGAEAPVDSERVARLRTAIAEGRYALSPSDVADRLLDLKREWNSQ